MRADVDDAVHNIHAAKFYERIEHTPVRRDHRPSRLVGRQVLISRCSATAPFTKPVQTGPWKPLGPAQRAPKSAYRGFGRTTDHGAGCLGIRMARAGSPLIEIENREELLFF